MVRSLILLAALVFAACGRPDLEVDHQRLHDELERDNELGAATSSLPDRPGVDLVQFGRDLTTSLFLEPAQLKAVSIQLRTDEFAQMNEPTGAVVDVRAVDRIGRPSVLTVSFEVAGRLQFLAAKGAAVAEIPGVENPSAAAAKYADVLAKIGGVSVVGAPTATTKSLQVRFSGAACELAPDDQRIAHFNLRTGILEMYGVPLPPAIIRWRANSPLQPTATAPPSS